MSIVMIVLNVQIVNIVHIFDLTLQIVTIALEMYFKQNYHMKAL